MTARTLMEALLYAPQCSHTQTLNCFGIRWSTWRIGMISWMHVLLLVETGCLLRTEHCKSGPTCSLCSNCEFIWWKSFWRGSQNLRLETIVSLESQSQRKTNLKFTVASNGVSGVSSPLQPWICLHRVLATDSSTTDAVASWEFATVPKAQLT